MSSFNATLMLDYLRHLYLIEKQKKEGRILPYAYFIKELTDVLIHCLYSLSRRPVGATGNLNILKKR
jgi:hypothetical protein